MGVVETKLHPVLVAGLFQLLQRVAPELARLDHVVVISF